MIDSRVIGSYISKLRKEADWTQVELADRLNVSHQAVSKWERGESLPDIGTLMELASTFHQSVDQILYGGKARGHAKPVDTLIRKIVEHPESAGEIVNSGEVTIDKLIDVAPLIKTSTLKEVTFKIDKQQFSLNHITELAPFLDDTTLNDLLSAVQVDDLNWETMESLAPFISFESIESLMNHMTKPPTLKEVVTLAPFLGEMTGRLLEDAVDADLITWDDMVSIAPFVNETSLKKLLDEHLDDIPNINELSQIAPFLNKHLDPLVRRALENNKVVVWDDIQSLAPFIEPLTLTGLLDHCNEDLSFQQCAELAPFMGDDKDDYFIRAANTVTWDDLQNIAPFVRKNTLTVLIKRLSDPPKNARQIADLAPFLESELLGSLLSTIPNDQIEPDILTEIAPFMKKSLFSEFLSKLLNKR